MKAFLIIFTNMLCWLEVSLAGYLIPVDSLITNNRRIVIEIRMRPAEVKDSISIGLSSVESLGIDYKFRPVKKHVLEGNAKWEFMSETPLLINNISAKFLKKQHLIWLLEPGDSILIMQKDNALEFTGKGAEKLRVQYGIAQIRNKAKRPDNPSPYITRSLSDYLEWNEYLNKQQALEIEILDGYKNRISSFSYQYIKSMIIERAEYYRINKFSKLRTIATGNKVENKNLSDIFNATFYGDTDKWMRSLGLGIGGSIQFIGTEVLCQYNFDLKHDSINTKDKRNKLYYEFGNRTYKALTRENFLVDLLTNNCIKKSGFTPGTEMLLARYYSESGYPEHKRYVKEVESKARRLRDARPAPDFLLNDIKDNPVNKETVKGKVVLMDFWFTGCSGCIQMASSLRAVKNTFRNDTNLVFMSISTDKEKNKWLESIGKKRYTIGEGMNLSTGEKGIEHEIIKAYGVSTYPSLYLLDGEGKVVVNPVPDPRADSGVKLTEMIKKELSLLQDGPYVVREEDETCIYSIAGSSVSRKRLREGDIRMVSVQGKEYGERFKVSLKERLDIEPSIFERQEKLFVVSDIEGNFDAFTKLLYANAIIDSNYNWIFDNGHLVINGDVFDRGEQVTECLWLIYSLEEKAKRMGGYVHFIIGNHEVMNMSGDHRYIKEKYKQNAVLLSKDYADLYGINTELGRWMRTKNVMEKIGDLLFVHGGVSKEINDLGMSIEKINELARQYYDKSNRAMATADKASSVLLNPKISPFWYREYYLDQLEKIVIKSNRLDTIYRTRDVVVDSTLSVFGVKHIITGHTIVDPGDKITVHYGNKIINTDTHHAKGKSEALMVLRNRFFRADLLGRKVLLFEDN